MRRVLVALQDATGDEEGARPDRQSKGQWPFVNGRIGGWLAPDTALKRKKRPLSFRSFRSRESLHAERRAAIFLGGMANLLKDVLLVHVYKMPNVAIERPSEWAKPACEGPSRMTC